MLSGQEVFLLDQVFSLTLMATTQRGKIYRNGSGEPSRNRFRQALRSALENLATQYKSDVSAAQHCANIEVLSKDLSSSHKEALNGERFRIGSAQKALNLYLKYLWCLDRIARPPHCPFDYRILSLIPNCETVKWTELDCISEYKRIVGEAEREAGDLSLSEWELRRWQLGQMTVQ